MKGLVIRSPWIDKILAGEKTWEMRSKKTSVRGRIALIRAGSGQIFGTAELVACLPKLNAEEMAQTAHFHAIPESQLDMVLARGWITPWVLRDIIAFPDPIPYSHSNGAVTWVNLPDVPQLFSGISSDIQVPTGSEKSALPETVAEGPGATASDECVDIRLSDENIRENQFYRSAADRLISAESISDPNTETLAAKTVRVRFDPGSLLETDIADVKAILRSRTQVGDFFARSGAQPGDSVRLCRETSHSFRVTLRKSST